MSFIRKITDEPVRTEHMRCGAGYILAKPILTSNEEMYNKGRVFQHTIIDPGCEIGLHKHEGEGETYYLIKGSGVYYRGDEKVRVQAGDITFCDDGESHGFFNDTDEPVEMIALILFK